MQCKKLHFFLNASSYLNWNQRSEGNSFCWCSPSPKVKYKLGTNRFPVSDIQWHQRNSRDKQQCCREVLRKRRKTQRKATLPDLNLENFRITCILCSKCPHRDYNKIMDYILSTDNPSRTCKLVWEKCWHNIINQKNLCRCISYHHYLSILSKVSAQKSTTCCVCSMVFTSSLQHVKNLNKTY